MVNEIVLITAEDKHTKTIRIPCINSAISGGSKHKMLVLNCITVVHTLAVKLVFKQYPFMPSTIDGN
jgi:hypothetical protein